MSEGISHPGQRLSTATDKVWRVEKGRQYSLLLLLQYDNSFSKYAKRGLWCARSVTLSKHVTHYSLQSGFPYYNSISPIERTPLSATRGRTDQLCGLKPWELSPVPSTPLYLKAVFSKRKLLIYI
jgi:hypothetical protein